MQPHTIPSASHIKTNDVIYDLITSHICPDSSVLDFGSGHGHMCQRLGNFFKSHGRCPAQHLKACEISPEVFEYAEIECLRIGTNSEIPVDTSTQDLIYAIEVLEHVPRPYDFFLEAAKKLKPGGHLVFSVPNLLNLKARLQFLFTGYSDMFGPPSALDKNAGRICGHIMPLSLPYFSYGLQRSGFRDVHFHADRWKRSSLMLSIMLFPLLKLATSFADRRIKRYDRDVWLETRWLISRVNHMDILASRSCIIEAQKCR